MKQLVLYSALYDSFYPFDEMGLFKDYKAVMKPEEMIDPAGCLVVWGGADISPSLYNKAVGRRTGASEVLSRRDYFEWELMKAAKEKNMPIIGICRGAQMLCALAGGFLIQDVTHHTSGHKATLNDGRELTVSSLHHQMMAPWGVPHEMIATSKGKRSSHYLDVDTPVEVPEEPEFVVFPDVKGYAIQWHPEYMSVDCEANQFVHQFLEERL